MFVVIVGKEGTEQIIKNVTNVSFNKNVLNVTFDDPQGQQNYEREMSHVGGLMMGHDESERKNLSTVLSGEPLSS